MPMLRSILSSPEHAASLPASSSRRLTWPHMPVTGGDRPTALPPGSWLWPGGGRWLRHLDLHRLRRRRNPRCGWAGAAACAGSRAGDEGALLHALQDDGTGVEPIAWHGPTRQDHSKRLTGCTARPQQQHYRTASLQQCLVSAFCQRALKDVGWQSQELVAARGQDDAAGCIDPPRPDAAARDLRCAAAAVPAPSRPASSPPASPS